MKRFLLTFLVALAFLAQAQNKPYITKVYDFLPAPGQFVNALPKYNDGDTKEIIISRVEERLCGKMEIEENELPDGTIVNDTIITISSGDVSLGSFGGYVVFGFDHPVVNVKGEYDMQIFGNAIQSDKYPSLRGGSSEPGIVMVSRDENGNGIPDDPWYELAGSEYNHPKTQKHFTVTYYKPDDSQFGPLGNGKYHDQYIRWTSNSVDSIQEGYVRKNSFHSQSYWPQWVEGETLTFEGTKLRGNAHNFSATADDWVLYFFDWGYVDNRPDEGYGYKQNVNNLASDELNKGFKIDWAVDDDGNPVELKQIDFVKVYCAMLQDCGWLGETSTEVKGAVDLHPDAVAEPDPILVSSVEFDCSSLTLEKGEIRGITATVLPEDATNQELLWVSSDPEVASVDQAGLVSALKNGLATITATATDGSEVSANCEVEVRTSTTGVVLSENEISLYAGGTVQLSAKVEPEDASDKTIVWASSDTTVVMVDSTGMVVANRVGTALVVASCGEISDTCHVFVTGITGLTLDKTELTIYVNTCDTLQVMIEPQDVIINALEWMSDNEEVATVIDGVITAKSIGSANIIVMATDGGGASDTCSVNVIAMPVRGDVNGDGFVTSADVTAIYDVLLGTDNTFEYTADVNGDGYITSADVTVVYDILLGVSN